MEHIAIMRKSWGLTKKILSGDKRIESRWYATRRAPWKTLKEGEIVYFKESGDPVTIKAVVSKVERFEGLTPEKVRALLKRMYKEDGIEKGKVDHYTKEFKRKRYCMLIHLKDPQSIKPFNIDKRGFGIMSAWISVESVDSIKAHI
jgi:ASC-1-like (ASCH) protein